MKDHQRPLPLAIYIEVSEKEAIRRLMFRGRADDTESAILNRLSFFSKYVAQVVRYYKKRGRIISINGNLPPPAVWHQLDKALSKKLGRRWPRK